MVLHFTFYILNELTLPQIKWLDKEGTEIEKNEKKKNIVDLEEEVEGTKLHNAVSTIKLKVATRSWLLRRGTKKGDQEINPHNRSQLAVTFFDRKMECMEHSWLRSTKMQIEIQNRCGIHIVDVFRLARRSTGQTSPAKPPMRRIARFSNFK